MIRPCPTCLRHTETERVPSSYRQVYNFKNGVAAHTVERAAPPYEICTHCGHFYGYVEDAPEPEPVPPADDGDGDAAPVLEVIA